MQQNNSISSEILNQLYDLVIQLNDEQYCKQLPILSKNSIGKHIRHIIEFYECLLTGIETGIVDYDARCRNSDYESGIEIPLKTLQTISAKLQSTTDCNLTLLSQYGENTDPIISRTSFNRELVYNVEHAVHHMAILRIAVNSEFQNVLLPDNFGIAYSTIQHQREQCAQ